VSETVEAPVVTETATIITETQAPADWRATLPDEIRNAPSMGKYATPADLAKGYLEAEKLIGKKGVILPGENATPEEMKQFHAALGVPETFDGYELKAPDGLPEGVWNDDAAKGFAAKAHELGLTPKQVQGIATWQVQNVAGALEKAGLEADGRTYEAVLREEWGGSYDAKFEAARRASKEFGGDEATLAKLGDKIGDAALIRMFARIGEKVAEDSPAGMGGGAQLTSQESAKAQADALVADTKGPYWNQMHPDHRATVQRVTKLFAQAGA
jgi:hypothetical protein